jgi:hypothetical protein
MDERTLPHQASGLHHYYDNKRVCSRMFDTSLLTRG